MEKYNFCLWHNMCCNMSRQDVCCIELLGVRDGKLIEIKEFLINPKTNNFEWVKSGITHEELKQHPPLEEQWDDIMAVARKYDHIVTITESYDDAVLSNLAARMDMEAVSYFSAKALLRVLRPMPCYSFDNICSVFGIPTESSFDVVNFVTTWGHILCQALSESPYDSIQDLLGNTRLIEGSISGSKFKRCHLRPLPKSSSRNKIVTAPVNLPKRFDETHPVFGLNVVFTGTLAHIVKQKAAELVWRAGGFVQDNITKKTNILVVGEQNPNVVGPDGLSSKQRKAIEYQQQGQPIEYMDEAEFLRMMDFDYDSTSEWNFDSDFSL